MARNIAAALRNAIDIDGSFRLRIKAEVSPSRIYFEAINDDFPISIPTPDPQGMVDDPVMQDIEYNATAGGLVTFYVRSNTIYFALQGGGINSLAVTATAKPGVLGSKLYAGNTTTLTRYSITWDPMSLASDGSVTLDNTIDAVHAISASECVAMVENNGGLQPVYWTGDSTSVCPSRFMFHLAVKPTAKTDEEIRQGKTDDTRTLIQKAICSGAAKLGTKVFVYVTNAFSGMVEGCYYDTDTGIWSTIFTVLPTDLKVSLCEFRIANVFEHNSTLYMAGQFNRTDDLDSSSMPHSFVLSSTNGKTFSINRNVLVSDLGYRFLARVGGGDLYLANCNRVCYAPVTWVFDGATGTAGTKTDISEDDIKGYGDSDLSKCSSFSLRSGLFKYFPGVDPNMLEGARMVVKVGYDVVPGQGLSGTDTSWVTYATYIIDSIDYAIGVGKRGTIINATNEALWNLSGLNMPFYAELLGKSCQFDPMLQGTSMLSSSGNGCIARESLLIDFWDHEGYTNTTENITGINMMSQGGVDYYEAGASHNHGIITRSDLSIACGLSENPTITATTLTAKVYGWSHADPTGSANDNISVVLVTVDDENNETTEIFTASNNNWPNTYPDAAAGEEPIVISMTGQTIGNKVKKIGVVFQCATATWFEIARVELTAGIRAYYPLYGADTPWGTEEKWGYYKLPRAGKPYVMIAAGPYNAYNFSLAGRFKDSYDAADTYIHSYCGVVGHCTDGLNYTVARYCKQHNKVQLIKCRDGIETQLKESVAVPFTINETYQIRLDHKDGHFEIYMVDDAVGYFKEVLGGYDWVTADGYMFTSDTVSMRSGIYGYINTPIAKTLGYAEVGDESGVTANGIPFAPLWDTTDFPTSGKARIMDNVYEYTSKVAHPTIPRGPYQFRQMGDYTLDPFLDDGSGLDARDFDWTGGTDHNTLNNGYLIALNSGANYLCNGTEWQVDTFDGGTPVPLYNRMRYYSANTMIGKTYHSLANKVWIVGGLLTVTLIEGKKMNHSDGSFVTYEPVTAGEILCYWFIGSGGEDDSTVEDLAQKICDLSGARCTFPGDFTDASLDITTTPQTLITTPYGEGFDLSFELASFTSGSISIRLNATLNPDNYENKASFADDTKLIINIVALGSGGYRYTFSSYDSGTVIYSTNVANMGTSKQKFRVMCMKDNIGLYQNGYWITTIPTDEIVYSNSLIVEIYASGSMTLTNVKETDLSDWREAIYIDLETDGMSALGSVIQQRPVEITAKADGSISLSYDPTRYEITAVRQPRQHTYIYSVPTDGASDAIIYGLKDVKTIINLGFAKHLGFATKVMRMPDLGVGALRAAFVILQRMLENAHKHNFSIRPDLALEPGDKYTFSYTAAGSNHAETRTIIVETVGFDYRASGVKVIGKMEVSGREEYSSWPA